MPFQPKTGFAPWEEIDQATLRQFLATVTGQRFLQQLFTRRPKARDKTDFTKRALQSAVAEGYESMYEEIDYMTKPESKRERPNNAAATVKALTPPGAPAV